MSPRLAGVVPALAAADGFCREDDPAPEMAEEEEGFGVDDEFCWKPRLMRTLFLTSGVNVTAATAECGGYWARLGD